MKKAFLLISLFFIALSACKKDSNGLNQPTTYRVDGITDMQINYLPGSVTYVSLTVNYVGPIQENVSLSLRDLPSGITMDTTQIHSGVPTFTTYFQLMNDGTAKPGTYKVKLVCNGSQTGEHYYNFYLKVMPKPTCSNMVVGAWAHNANCTGTLYADSVILDPAGIQNRIVFTNFDGGHISIYADLDCMSGIINIPNQSAGGHTYSGNGSFFATNMNLNFMVDSASGGTFCSDAMSR